jgi:acyl-CoA thioester hydrolase
MAGPAAPYPIEPENFSAPFDVYRGVVRKEWTDWNGHMNVGYYVVAFDHGGTTALCRQLGIAAEYTRDKIGMYFVLEGHATYEQEIHEGDEFGVATQVLDHDAKRLHIFHTMYVPATRQVVATNEVMLMNIDFATRRPAPWPAWALHRIQGLAASHSALARPKQAGSVIGIRRKGP